MKWLIPVSRKIWLCLSFATNQHITCLKIYQGMYKIKEKLIGIDSTYILCIPVRMNLTNKKLIFPQKKNVSPMFKDIFYSTRFRFSQFDSDFVPLSIIPYDFHIHFLEFMHLMSLLFKPWKPGTTILNRLIFSFLLLDFPQPKTVG